MYRSLLTAAFIVLTSATVAPAACFGSGAFRNCTDNQGNSYSVQRYGNTTIMNGSNARTGARWNQQSQTYGNNTYTTGRAADGNSWNMQQQRIGNNTYYSGRDSSGRRFSGSCNQFGCN